MCSIQEYDASDHLYEMRTTGFCQYLPCFFGVLQAVRTYPDLDEFMSGEFVSDLGLQRISGPSLSHLNNGFEMVAEGT